MPCMLLLAIIFGIWGILVFFTPIGIWNAKGRISALEKQVWELKGLLKSQSNGGQEKVIPDPIKPVSTAIYIQEEQQEKITVEVIKEAEVTSEIKGQEKQPVYAAKSYGDEFTVPDWLRSALTGGKLFVTLGILLLFIGIVMLFKYASHYLAFPIEARFASVALSAFAMIAFGMSQMGKRRDYGLYLQGGGLGMLFLTVYTAFKFYNLLPADIAFIMLVAIGAATFALSITANSIELSVLAVTGGFVAPLLASTGHGNHITLFSYYLVINLVIFAIAWKKTWRLLNTIGFLFTFSIASLWGVNYYRPEYYSSMQMFLIVYFLLYVVVGILYSSRKDPKISNPIDAASIFGVPLIGYGLQLSLVQDIANGKTISTLAMGIFYTVLFIALRQSKNSGLKFLSQIFMSLAILFFTLVIPFTYGHHTTAILWSMEGACLLWIAGKTKDKLNQYAGIAVLLVSNFFMLDALDLQGIGPVFLNSFFLSCTVMSITHIAASYMVRSQDFQDNLDKDFITVFFSGAGMLWWFYPGFSEINSHFGNNTGIYLIFYSVSALVLYNISLYWRIILTEKPIQLMLFSVGIASAFGLLENPFYKYHPFMGYGYIGFPLAFAAHYYWLWHDRGIKSYAPHYISFLALIALAGLEAGYQLYSIDLIDSYLVCGWLLAIICGILLLSLPKAKQFWPFDILNTHCRIDAGLPLVYTLFAICLYSFTLASVSPYEKYIPFFNILDLVELASLISLFAFYMRSGQDYKMVSPVVYILATLSFAFINCVMLRIISVHTSLAYFSHEMFASMFTQTCLTILWALAAMASMILSSRYKFRRGWLIGAGLLGIVVIKLFIRDLDGSGTLERIISFIGVGLLSLVLGYISPMPPRKEA